MSLEERLDRLESQGDEFRQIAGSLREPLIVTSGIQERQSVVLKEQAEILSTHSDRLERLDKSVERLMIAVDELADKLNGII